MGTNTDGIKGDVARGLNPLPLHVELPPYSESFLDIDENTY